MSDARPRCECGKLAKFLCDALVPITPERIWDGYRTGEGPSATCDAPICEKHRTFVAPTFLCRGSPHGPHDSRDHCPRHA